IFHPTPASTNGLMLNKNKVTHHRIELRTTQMLCKTKTTMYQLSICSIYILSQGTILEGFLILLESKNFIPDMTPEPCLLPGRTVLNFLIQNFLTLSVAVSWLLRNTEDGLKLLICALQKNTDADNKFLQPVKLLFVVNCTLLLFCQLCFLR